MIYCWTVDVMRLQALQEEIPTEMEEHYSSWILSSQKAFLSLPVVSPYHHHYCYHVLTTLLSSKEPIHHIHLEQMKLVSSSKVANAHFVWKLLDISCHPHAPSEVVVWYSSFAISASCQYHPCSNGIHAHVDCD